METTWSEHKKIKKYPPLNKDVSADVAIIGGGMTGILNAYALSKAGLKVVLIEKDEIGSGATYTTTAFITEIIDSKLSQISSIFSPETAKTVWQSGRQAIEEFARIIREERIECEFRRCPNYIFASNKKQFKELEKENKFYERFKFEAKLETNGKDLGFPNYGYLEVPDQAKFHPAKFLYRLAEKASDEGALIFEKTAATNITSGKTSAIKTPRGTIFAKDVIIATYKPLTNKKTHLKKAMYRSYVFEVQVPKNTFKEALYEDNGNPYHYFRIDSSGEKDDMIIGGEDHRDIFGGTLAKKSFKALEEFLKRIMNGRPYKIIKRWYGPISEPSDGLPLIGKIAPHLYVGTGFSGNGMTYSMISSFLMRDLILGRKNYWVKAYDPSRTLLHPKRLGSKARDYAEEFLKGALKNALS